MNHEKFPTHASVIVVGGGIMGCSTLYHLAKMGVTDAILLERNKLTSGTTWHSAAQVRALRNLHVDDALGCGDNTWRRAWDRLLGRFAHSGEEHDQIMY